MKKSNRNNSGAVTRTRLNTAALYCVLLGQLLNALGRMLEVKFWFSVPALILFAVALCCSGALLVREVKKLSAEKQQKEKECSPTSNEGAAETL